jgi:DNA uptake protein ComE-like DNA-binding protein
MNRHDRHIALAAIIVALLALTALVLYDSDKPATAIPQQSHYSQPSHPSSYSHGSQHSPSPRESAGNYSAYTAHSPQEFPFDPNTADSTQLLRLGLQPWQVRNIYKYRMRGGIYRRKEDFARLYGLTVKDYRRLEPYIRISSDYLPAATLVGSNDSGERDTTRFPQKLHAGEHVILNTADTTMLKRVPGIGSYYAREIVRHGERLGGYVSIDQLDEIDHFPQTAKQYLVISQPVTRKLNINKLSINDLRRHPYLNYYQAKAIADYRRLHGRINSLDELRLSRDFPEEVIKRLEPYIEF